MPLNCYGEAEEDPAVLEAESENGDEMVASKEEMIKQDKVVEEGMVPIPGSDIKDGEYSVDVASSSSMFKIVDCVLTVKDGKMTAVMTLSGQGYLKLFIGTGEEAVQAPEEEYIPFAEDKEGKYTYEVPVEALDKGIACTAFSKNKQKWYDRTLVFQSSSLPQDAFLNLETATVESLGLEDGAYQVDVLLEGGSGKTAVESPASMIVSDGAATATIVWGSPKYDYMKVDGQQYLPVNTEGNAAFEIPVESFDWKMPIIVDSVALGKPVEKGYTLTFDSSSVKAAE